MIKLRVPYEDILENWAEIEEGEKEVIMNKVEDSSLWGKILSYVLDTWIIADFYYDIPEILVRINEKIRNENIRKEQVQDFVNIVLEEMKNFLEKAEESEEFIEQPEVEYYLPIIGALMIKEEIPLLKKFAKLFWYEHVDRRPKYECEYYYRYRRRAIEALWEIGKEDILKIYSESLKDINYEVVETALNIIGKINTLKAKKIIKNFYFNWQQYEHGTSNLNLSQEIYRILNFRDQAEIEMIERIIFTVDHYYYGNYWNEELILLITEKISGNTLLNFTKNFVEKIIEYESYERLSRIVEGLYYQFENEKSLKMFFDYLENEQKNNPMIAKQIKAEKEKYLEKENDVKNYINKLRDKEIQKVIMEKIYYYLLINSQSFSKKFLDEIEGIENKTILQEILKFKKECEKTSSER